MISCWKVKVANIIVIIIIIIIINIIIIIIIIILPLTPNRVFVPSDYANKQNELEMFY